jgi:hypothetical protein
MSVNSNILDLLTFRSKPQYGLQLSKWGFSKNIKKCEWLPLFAEIERREAEGKETEVLLSGKPLSQRRLAKERSRYTKLKQITPTTQSMLIPT